MSAPRSPRARAVRRELARKSEAFVRSAEKLARLSAGGTPDHPIELLSASQVEVHARSMPCPICQGEQLLEEHVARTVNDRRLRVATTRCRVCGAGRSIYFRLGTPLPS